MIELATPYLRVSINPDGGATASSWLTMALFDATAAPVVGVERDGVVHLD